MASVRLLDPRGTPGNRGFANRARGFANRASSLPGFPVLPVAALAAVAVMGIVGAFGTGAMPPAMRFGFWLVLIGWNAVKWQAWFAWRVHEPEDWARAAALGALLINLPLPLEIAATLSLFGVSTGPVAWKVWVEAAAISGAIFAVMLVLAARERRGREALRQLPRIAPDGVLNRAGIREPSQLAGVEAEDHFCRLHLADGRSLLVHARFGDALAELRALDGAQVHRGAWAAAPAVKGAIRADRRWRIELTGGARVPVSARFVADAKARGWLRPPL